jgi:hypothetical protein
MFDKKKGKKFFLFIEHEVLFYETPFLHRARRIYFCGAAALARPVVAGRVLNFGTKEGTDRGRLHVFQPSTTQDK